MGVLMGLPEGLDSKKSPGFLKSAGLKLDRVRPLKSPVSRSAAEHSRVWRVCPVRNNPDEFQMAQCLPAAIGAFVVTLDPVAV
jgi:hypothetical protein